MLLGVVLCCCCVLRCVAVCSRVALFCFVLWRVVVWCGVRCGFVRRLVVWCGVACVLGGGSIRGEILPNTCLGWAVRSFKQ